MSDKRPDFEGLTAKACCTACTPKKCVITGAALCGHPHKASLAGASPKVKERILAAKQRLAIQRAEKAA